MTATFAIAIGLLAGAPLWAIVEAVLARTVPTSRFRAGGGLLIAWISVIGCVLLVIVGIDAAIGNARPVLNLGGWLGLGHSALRAGGLAGIFLALTGLAGAATSLAYGESGAGRGLTGLGSLLLFCVAVVIASANAFLFFLAWEGLGVCIYLLASSNRDDPEALLGGYFTFGLTKLGGGALLAALALLYGHTHTFDMSVWAHAHLSPGTAGVTCMLLLIAFGSKVGLLPIQGGLPAGYSSAPAIGAASLSVALSAGFYGLWRFEIATLSPPAWCGDVFLVLGSITAMTGIVYAITQDDLRRFLGYSSIENAGIILLGLGVALLGQSGGNRTLEAAGLIAATLHVCAHNLAKTLALLGVGYVERETGQRALRQLGGRSRTLRLGAISTGFAAMTLCALPPLGGFVGEWFTFEALLQGFRIPSLLSELLTALAAACLALTAGIGLLAFAKFYSFIFLGPSRTAAVSPTAATPRRPALSLIGLGVIVLFLGAVAPWEIRGLSSGLAPILHLDLASSTVNYPLALGPVFTDFASIGPSWLIIVMPGYAILAALFGRHVGGRRGVRRAPVWVTGSAAELADVQYRPAAYSNPMRVVLHGPLGFVSKVVRSGDNPARLELRTTVVLAVDRFVYRPLTRWALVCAAVVRRSQSGRLSVYLLYMLIALILALALIPILH